MNKDILPIIFSYLSVYDKIKSRLVCRIWRDLLGSVPKLWAAYNPKCRYRDIDRRLQICKIYILYNDEFYGISTVKTSTRTKVKIDYHDIYIEIDDYQLYYVQVMGFDTVTYYDRLTKHSTDYRHMINVCKYKLNSISRVIQKIKHLINPTELGNLILANLNNNSTIIIYNYILQLHPITSLQYDYLIATA